MQNYYNVGTVDDIVVSNSSLTKLNPEEGGDPVLFLNFFRNKDEEKDTLSLSRGRLLHTYIENSDQFCLTEGNLPPEMMQKCIQFIRIYNSEEESEETLSIVIPPSPEKAKEDLELQDACVKFKETYNISEVNKAYRIFLLMRQRTKAYQVQKDVTLLNNLSTEENKKYFEYLNNSEGKIMVSKADKDVLDNCIKSLENHPTVPILLNLNNTITLDDLNVVMFKELPIYWQMKTKVLGQVEECRINMKALLDNLKIDFEKKTIVYTDLKSTKNSILEFSKAFEWYRYYRQVGMYKFAIMFWFMKTYPKYSIQEFKLTMYLVPIQNHFPYKCTVYKVPLSWIKKGQQEVKSLLERVAWHKTKKEWQFTPEEILNNHVLTFEEPKL